MGKVGDYLRNDFMRDAKLAVKEAIERLDAKGIEPVYIEPAAPEKPAHEPAAIPPPGNTRK
jgi:hypothetical protein